MEMFFQSPVSIAFFTSLIEGISFLSCSIDATSTLAPSSKVCDRKKSVSENGGRSSSSSLLSFPSFVEFIDKSSLLVGAAARFAKESFRLSRLCVRKKILVNMFKCKLKYIARSITYSFYAVDIQGKLKNDTVKRERDTE